MRKTQIDQGIIDKMEVQKDNIMKAIKKIPELREYAFPDTKKKQNQKEDKAEGADFVEVEKRDQRDIVTIEEEIVSVNERTRKPKKMQSRKTYFIWVDGKKIQSRA